MKKRHASTQERLAVIAVILVLWMCGVGARLVHLQVYQHGWLEARAIRQQERTVEVTATRGRIVDRRGRELARSVEAPSVYATLSDIKDPKTVARQLAKLLGVPEQTLLERLTCDRSFVCLKRKVDKPIADAVAALKIDGIEFVQEMKRFYPKNELGSHVLGFVGADGEGLSGLEQTFDEQMHGRDGRAILATDARQQIYDASEIAPTPGNDIQLTIDEIAQYRVEQALAEGVRASGANWGIAIVIRPQTGEILALANYPTFDAHDFGKAADDVRRNRAVEAVFEPGSVFKIVPYSGCIDRGLITPSTMIDCQFGEINVNGRIVHDHPFGTMKASDALALSSNVAAIKMGMKLGNAQLYDYIRSYGFGAKTGVEVPGESAGLVEPLAQWNPTTIGSIPMGHEVGVTALQEVAAMAALANGGVWVRPHLVQRIVSPSGQIISETQADSRRVVSTETAQMMTGMLEGVVVHGTARHANLGNLGAAGKTGTAQKIDPRSHRYSQTKYTASFCGYAPAEAPELACIVVLDEPHAGGHTGGATAAPIFGKILDDLFGDYAIPLETPQTGRQVEIAAAQGVERRGLEMAAVAPAAPPPAPVPVPEGPEIQVVAANNDKRGIVVPDLAGKGLRSATAAGLDAGLIVEARGSGVVLRQRPLAGTVVSPGTVLSVELGR